MTDFMKNILFSLFFFSVALSQGQDVKLYYSKGSSLLSFDLDSKTERLSNRLGLSLSKNKYEFQIGYSTFNFSYDGEYTEADDLYKNYYSDIQSAHVSYSHLFTKVNSLKFNLGLELAYSKFSIFTNLASNQGLNYIDFPVDQWRGVGFYSENNYETNLSDLNIDQVEDYNLNYLNFGPSIECVYELVDNFEISLKSIYRTNMTDFLDNVDVNNLRDIYATTATDNQIDVMLGFKFCLNNKKRIDNDSLVSLIDSITNSDSISETAEFPQETIEEQIEYTSDEEVIIKDNQAYILGYFNFDSETVNSTAERSSEELESENIRTTNFSDTTATEKVETNIQSETFDNESDTAYYLIVGVFSSSANLVSFAQSLNIDSSNTLLRNGLNYLYLLKTNNIEETRQLRDNLSYESWILTTY